LTPHGWCSSTRLAHPPRWHVCMGAAREGNACGSACQATPRFTSYGDTQIYGARR
jgi:hypothetical protein